MVESLAGVIIWTENLADMTAFYREKLALPVHSTRPNFVAFQLGDVRFSIGLHSAVHGMTQEPLRVMVNLGVDDIQAEYSRLCATGVRFLREPEREHWGGWVATFQDPDGNTLQLLQQP